MIETKFGNFEIIHDPNNAFNIVDFEKKYVELFNLYEILVCDYSQENLRIKGFNMENKKTIPDYINEYCVQGCTLYILKNLSFDKNYKLEEK